MSWFEYKGRTPGDTPISGRIEAADPQAARAELERMQIGIDELHAETPKAAGSHHISTDELIFFNEQLIGLAHAGLALDEGLAQLARDVETPRLRHWIEGLVDDLRRGMTIEQAIAARESGLPVLYSEVVRAGIETGRLPSVLFGLNQHLRTAGTTRMLIWEAAAYPLVVATLAMLVISFFFVKVVPSFRAIYQDFGARLPQLTILALAISEHFPMILLVLAVVLAGVLLTWGMLPYNAGGRRFREQVVLGMPVLGGVHRASLIARFLRAVAVGLQTGMPLPRAIRLSSSATGSTVLNADAELMAADLERGASIDHASELARLIPPLFGYCLKAAGSGDDLPVAIAQLARSYEDRAVHAQGLLRAVLLPLFILTVGGVLFLAVLAMFLPLVTLINSVSGGG